MNKAIIMGNLGRDPETKSGVCKLNVATSRKWKDKQGQLQEETEWHRITVFGNTARACQDHLNKGSQVLVEGRIKTSSYEKDGEKRYSTEVIADRVDFVGGRGSRAEGSQPAPAPYDPGGFKAPDGNDGIPF